MSMPPLALCCVIVREKPKVRGWIAEKTGCDPAKLMFSISEEPQHPGGGDLFLVTPKVAMHAEGRSANMPIAIARMRPVMGGRRTVYMEINPVTARERNIRDGDRIRVTSDVGSIQAICKYFEGTRLDTLVMPMEHGHWAKGRGPGHNGEVTINQSDRITGQCNYYTTKVRVARA
jgi:thiosulfate reductase/polysulfide reductase chain A